jgi:ectoine hydroxylase-related dioxygenase (phytanoyl-CoA dioxygenase family)
MPLTCFDIAEDIRTRGFAVVPGMLPPVAVAAAREALDAVLEREAALAERRGWRNRVYRCAYNLPQKHPLFRSFCRRSPLVDLMRGLLGERCVISNFNGHSMTPGGETQPLHIDQDELIPGALLSAQGLIALDDFTRDNGCTRVVPGSHLRPRAERDAEDLEAMTIRLEAPAGSALIWNAALLHAGSQNRTDRPRRALSIYFTKPWVLTHCDFTQSLSPEVIAELDDEQKALLGFSVRPQWYDYRTDEIRNSRY